METTKVTGPVSVEHKEVPFVWMKLGEDGKPEKVLDQGNNIAQKMWNNYRQCEAPADPALAPQVKVQPTWNPFAPKEGV